MEKCAEDITESLTDIMTVKIENYQREIRFLNETNLEIDRKYREEDNHLTEIRLMLSHLMDAKDEMKDTFDEIDQFSQLVEILEHSIEELTQRVSHLESLSRHI